ncbi:type VI toxin-antitoxin system SocA family antitoxin [Algirhabdus cladophorae]|uniref:type VI toxin-antitoxin system SocA family antitoxin n=1 Tax=Algirhabdus cladophorae TaxID=3377108 RepID=UPI003B84AB2E
MDYSKGTDARIVANCVLDARDFINLPTTQIELQKLLYFCHESFLVQYRKRLVSGYFEAWQYGPVHPVVYDCFKKCKGEAILERAAAYDLFSGEKHSLPKIEDTLPLRHITETVSRLSVYSAGQLIDLSHLEEGPWHSVVQSAKNSVALGLRITDDVILENRTHSMLMREGRPAEARGELPNDESPFT